MRIAWLAVMVVSFLGLAGCGPKPTPTSMAMTGREKSFYITGRNEKFVCHSYLGLCHETLDAALEAVKAKNEAEIAALRTDRPIGGTARVVIGACSPAPAFRKGYENFDAAYAQYNQIMRESRLKALLTAKLFDSVEVVRKDACGPELDGRDHVIWTDGWKWFLRVDHGTPTAIFTTDDQAMTAWVTMIRDARDRAVKSAANRFKLDTEIIGGKALLFRFDGKEILDPALLLRSLIDSFEKQTAEIKPAAKRPGGRALLVLPMALASADIPMPQPEQVPFMRLHEVIKNIYGRVVMLAKVDALRRAELFDDMQVQVRDERQPPISPEHDWVIVQSADNHDLWAIRAGKADALPLPSALGAGGVADWTERVATIMADIKTVGAKPSGSKSF